MILKFKLLGSSVDAWEAPLEPVLLLVFRVLTNSKNKIVSSKLSFVIPFNQIHDRATSIFLCNLDQLTFPQVNLLQVLCLLFRRN
ncbi:MAG: hypothetical protein ACI85I_002537 [Arenicella sp.]|jgi:hypothetical protein